jgi:hypothetical protein
MYDHQTTIRFIESRFPDLADDLHDEIADGLLHVQMGVFSRLAQSAIDSENEFLWNKVTNVFMCLWEDCTPDVENALNVSFLENLNFDNGKGKRAWAYNKMPGTMQKAFDEMEAYNRKIHGANVSMPQTS